MINGDGFEAMTKWNDSAQGLQPLYLIDQMKI